MCNYYSSAKSTRYCFSIFTCLVNISIISRIWNIAHANKIKRIKDKVGGGGGILILIMTSIQLFKYVIIGRRLGENSASN